MHFDQHFDPARYTVRFSDDPALPFLVTFALERGRELKLWLPKRPHELTRTEIDAVIHALLEAVTRAQD